MTSPTYSYVVVDDVHWSCREEATMVCYVLGEDEAYVAA